MNSSSIHYEWETSWMMLVTWHFGFKRLNFFHSVFLAINGKWLTELNYWIYCVLQLAAGHLFFMYLSNLHLWQAYYRETLVSLTHYTEAIQAMYKYKLKDHMLQQTLGHNHLGNSNEVDHTSSPGIPIHPTSSFPYIRPNKLFSQLISEKAMRDNKSKS